MKEKIRGYLTVYLAMSLGVLVTLSMVLIEGVRSSTLELEALCASSVAADSIMAEYHRVLLERFGILALDSSYGSRTVGWENTGDRLALYLGRNLMGAARQKHEGIYGFLYRDFLKMSSEEPELLEVSILSDYDGEVFRQQAVRAMTNDLGLTGASMLMQWMETVEEYHLDTRNVEAEKQQADEVIASYQDTKVQIDEDEWETIHFENPTDEIERQRKKGIVKLILGDKALSGKRLNPMGLIQQRIKDGRANTGNVPAPKEQSIAQLTNHVLFQEYLLRYLGDYLQVRENSVLDYAVEYTIVGKDTDAENLAGVFGRITAMREAANAAFLYDDKGRKTQAEWIAWGIAILLESPELKEALTTAILLGWAYAESVYDMRLLAAGNRVPLIKDDATWHYDLWNALSFWMDASVPAAGGEGLCYEDYLRILMTLTGEEKLALRAMDIVEGDVRLTEGNKAFRLDGCYVGLKTSIGISSAFGYQTEIVQERYY